MAAARPVASLADAQRRLTSDSRASARLTASSCRITTLSDRLRPPVASNAAEPPFTPRVVLPEACARSLRLAGRTTDRMGGAAAVG